MKRLYCLLAALALACSPKGSMTESQPAAAAGEALYDGKVLGIYKLLEVSQASDRITVSGETFAYAFDISTGQVVSARALGDEFLAEGASFPDPYVGVMPENDPGANQVDPARSRPRYSFEKEVEMRPKLFSGGLTGAYRYDCVKSTGVTTRIVSSGNDEAHIEAGGEYLDQDGKPSGVKWQVVYRIDVDGFTKVTVRLSTDKPVKLRWNCFNHTLFNRESINFLARYEELVTPPFDIRPTTTVPLAGIGVGEPALESHWNPIFHLGNPRTGIEFTKEDFSGRLSGYRDSGVELLDGRHVQTGSVETGDGRFLDNHDSRGRTNIFTQIYMREAGLELEDFDIRNTTCPLNPGEVRESSFYVQLTPPKTPRDDLNSSRIIWPGPHQIRMAWWKGDTSAWEPPSDEQVRQCAQVGINLIVGGANYFSGDYAHPTQPEKIHHFLETAHGYGIKVIPYVTFSDWNFEAPGYQQHAADWMCSKAIEFAGHTSLMCFGAEGWRKHVEAQCDTLLAEFPFDGLYVDHWFTTRHCFNARHGCGGYLGRFVTDGYHDFAKRLRRVVARHTEGRGIMLLNSNNLISSTNLSWFDMRLLGENNDPLLLPGETILSTWNGKRQGVQSAIMWRENQDPLNMMNFCATFGFSYRLRRSRETRDIVQDWSNAAPGSEVGFNRLYWDVQRFFGVNEAKRFSAFDSRDVISLSQPGSQVAAFARDGKLLLSMGFLMQQDSSSRAWKTRPVRKESLSIHQPDKLGLDSGTRYRIIDLVAGTYLDDKEYTLEDLKSLPLSLTLGVARLLLVEPAAPAPRVVFFRGADGATVEKTDTGITATLNAVEGSPVSLYVDTGGATYRPATPGIQALPASGSLAVFAGSLPADRVIRLERAQ